MKSKCNNSYKKNHQKLLQRVYANKLGNLEETGRVLEKYNLPKLVMKI